MAAKGKKLTGAALARARTNIKKAQAALRRKFAGKKPKSAKNKRKSNPRKSVAKTKTVTKHKRHSKLEAFIKGGFGGAGVGETAGVGLDLVGLPPVVSIPVRLGTSAVGGYYIGDKKIEGLLGGIIFELIPSLLTLFGGGTRTSRLSGL